MPSIETSTASGAVPGSAPPTACTMRPQLGSPPCSAAFTSGELATARAAASTAACVAAAHDHAREPPRALAVGDHHDRELAQQRVERLAEAQLVLALGRDAHAAGARAHQDRRVVGRELPVDRGAVEGALDAHAEQQLGGLGRQRGVGLHEAEHRREARRDHARALALRAQAHRARGQRDLEVGALLERVGRLDRAPGTRRRRSRSRLRARREDALQHRARRAGTG